MHLSIPGYIPGALKRIKRENPKGWKALPHIHNPPDYGVKKKFSKEEVDEPMLGDKDEKYMQQDLGTFLYYAHSVDSTMIVRLKKIASEQARPTKSTMKNVDHSLYYATS